MTWQTLKCKCGQKNSVDDDMDAEKGLLTECNNNNERRCYFPIRLMVAILSAFAVFNTNTLRLNISIALVAMVNESALMSDFVARPTQSHDVCGVQPMSLIETEQPHKKYSEVQDGPFVWDEATRGFILSAYFWGNVFGQIPGGMLADRFGGKKSLNIGIFVSSIATLLVPTAAYHSVTMVVVLRVICGLSQGMALPALYTLLVHWVPHDEKSRLAGLTYTGVSLGKVVVFPISGFLCDSTFLGGWPSVFYVFGAFAMVWCIAFMYLVHDNPAEDPKVSKRELAHIESNTGVAVNSKNRKINWKRMVTSVPLWTLFLSYFAASWGAQILLTILPSYLKFAMNFDMKSSGLVNGLPHMFAVFVGVGAGIGADVLQNAKLLSPTNVRKLFAGISLFGPMFCLIGVTFMECDRTGLVIFLSLSVVIASLNAGGLFINEMDLSMKLAGTLKGMTNFASNLAGIIAPYAAGLLVENNESLSDWNKVFYLSSAVLFIGAVLFLLFGSAEDQHFCDFDEDDKTNSGETAIVSENNNYRSYGSNQEINTQSTPETTITTNPQQTS